jgi:hypothetical protein
MFEAGLVIVPVGGVSFGEGEIWTMLATDGTPALLSKNSM